jgi:lipooligosaccharide transport system ATP-binding protein
MPRVASGAIVEANGLSKEYGGRRVVDALDFRVRAGECLGVLGPNGAGKTTTIKMVTCFTAPTAGELRVCDLPVTPANHAAIKARLGIVQQDESLDPDLTVEMNLVVYAGYFDIPRAEAARRAEELIRFAELGDHRSARIRTLSGGMKRRLMLGRALLNDPTLLVLDEPTTGLDPQARRLVWERIRTLKRQGTTILLTTHYMEEAAQLCDRLIVMDQGRIISQGTPAELIKKHVGAEVVEVYLPGPDDEDERVVARLTGGDWWMERVGQVVYLYVRDAEAARRAVEALDHLDFTRRRATLEDVFLTLTGHVLRD